MSTFDSDFLEFGDSKNGDGIYQNSEVNEPIYENIENGAPIIKTTPKIKPTPALQNVEKRKKGRRNRNPRNPIKSHAASDIYSFDSTKLPRYHQPSQDRNGSSDDTKRRKKLYIIPSNNNIWSNFLLAINSIFRNILKELYMLLYELPIRSNC